MYLHVYLGILQSVLRLGVPAGCTPSQPGVGCQLQLTIGANTGTGQGGVG